jgi:hypothetical protein
MSMHRRCWFLALLAGCGTDPAELPLDAAPEPVPGFRVETFADYRTLLDSTIEASIDRTWDDADDFFSLRATATLDVIEAGTYTFTVTADDGVRLWVGDQLVIDDWRPHFPETHAGSIELQPGPVDFRLEYFEVNLSAELHLTTEPALAAFAGPGGAAAPTPPYANPVIGFDCPDPGVAAVGEPPVYYALCTGGSFPIRRSYDLVRWEDTGAVVLPDGKPPWAANGGRNWAPEIHEVDGKFVVYYTTVNGANVLSIGAAVADAPTGPYADIGGPLVEDAQGVIDATYVADGGTPYLVYKIDGNAHGNPTPIYIRQLAADGLSFAPGSQAVEILRNDGASWEGGVVEAPWIVERDGTYYLFYSGNVYDHRYRTGVARADSITGPYQKHGAPILANNAAWVGPGHGSVVAVGERLYFVYHAWHATAEGTQDGARGRVVLIDAIDFADGWPTIHDGTPSTELLPWPAP